MSQTSQVNLTAEGNDKYERGLSATDPNEKNISLRIDEIHEAIGTVKKKRTGTSAALATGEIDGFDARSIVREAVELLIEEVEMVAKQTDYLKEEYWEGDEDDPLGVIEVDNADTAPHVIAGLEDYVQFENPLVITEEIEPDPPMGMAGPPTIEAVEGVKTTEVQMPREISINAYRRVRGLLSEVGLDVPLTKPNEAEFSYEDILVTGPPPEES